MTYKDGKLTVGRGMYKTYTTSWAGWAHYWGSTDQNGIKMHIHAADPRMSTTTNKLVFLDSDRSLYIDLYCRTMYQTSDEKLKTNIRSLKTTPVSRSAFSINIATAQSNPSTNMVLKLNPVKYHWRDESEYERLKKMVWKGAKMKTGIMKYHPSFVAQRKMQKEFQDKGYNDIFIPNMMVLSPQYAEYKKALDKVNDRMCRELGLHYDSNYNLVIKKSK